jgi:outer membrane protein assembly factor BamB
MFNNTNEILWKRIAIIAGIFSLVICILLIANYIQINKADPVNMSVIKTLTDRLYQNPNDNQLREEIRVLDLLSRKAYFTDKWQIRTGGYLVLAGISIVIIALQIIILGRKRNPGLTDEVQENITLSQKKARRWIIIGGASILVSGIVFAYFSQNDLKYKFSGSVNNLIINQKDSSGNNNQQTPVNTNADTINAEASEQPSIMAKKDSIVESNGLNNNDNYPNFRGPGGNGKATQKNIPLSWNGQSGHNILWKTEIPLSGYNSPVIWGNKIFLTGANNSKREIYCIDKNSGKILWTNSLEKIAGSPVQAPKVSAETGLAAPTAATDGTGVFAIFANGDITGVDMMGKTLWAENLGDPQNHYGHSSSLMIYKNMVIVQFDQRNSPKLIALSVKTGKTVWSTNRPVKLSWSSPIIVNTGKRTEIILDSEPYVASYNPDNGAELWKIDCISGEVGPSLTYANGIVFSVNDYSKLSAIQLGNQPKIIWENTDFLSDIPSPVATEKYLFLVTSFGTVVCYDAINGTKYWQKEFSNSIYSSPVIADNRVYLLDRTGIMHIFKADKEYVSLGEPVLGEKSACTPAFSNGRIYLRGDKNLFCIGK